MDIVTDERGFVIGYSLKGRLGGAVDYEGPVPSGFYEACTSYALREGALVLDETLQTMREQVSQKQQACLALQDELDNTDYLILKAVEPLLLAAEQPQQQSIGRADGLASDIARRQAIRQEKNKLEKEIRQLMKGI